MKEVLSIALAAIATVVAAGSDPRPIRMEQARLVKSSKFIFGVPVPGLPAPREECVVIDSLLAPNFSLATSLLGRLESYNSAPNARAMQLLNESEDLRQAREEFRRFWMNNQPALLPAAALRGAVGP